jgi:sterol O-acyltransferase
MLMKQHSFAFYNGHLSEVYKRKKSLQAKLEELGSLNPTTAGTPASPIATRALATSYFDQSSPDQLKRRRRSLHHASDLHSEQDEADMQSVVAAIRSGDALSINQVEAFERVLETEIEALEKELTGKCTDTENHYPLNLTLINFIDYIPLPTGKLALFKVYSLFGLLMM